MKLKAQDLYSATLIVAAIVREQRPMPLKGKYRLARLHAKLLPEFSLLDAQRDEMIKAYDHKEKIRDASGEIVGVAENFSVPAGKLAEFAEAWGKIVEEEIEVDVEPIPLAQLDLGDAVDGSLHASELIGLGGLVTAD